jgi:Gpi18-like mannosyltransferase
MSFLNNWVDAFRIHGFSSAITMDIGDYNLPYQYILAGIARSSIPDLYLIKMVSVVFDFALAVMAALTVGRFMREQLALPALAILLLLPTGWLNSAYWAQCDSLYAFFVVACLYAMLADRPLWSAAMLAVAFAFKLQTVFFLPMVLFGLLRRKYKLRHAWMFLAVYLLTLLPALLAGRGLLSALAIYGQQAAQYGQRLTNNAPNIYQFFPAGMMRSRPEYLTVQFLPGVYAMRWNEWFTEATVRRMLDALVPFAGALVASLVYYLYRLRKYVALEQVWRLSLAFSLLMPLVLP